ncbi:hypothetical protein IHQ71_17755 [Rhizobium sp. TH2]|uniref:hypothetical protein n=1 Tax=Rhizobium sp. TH2 TaxID=2775403 RepID=UPI0021576CE1|nr:hypothetical protein [Rhizobium sp. TH2]UVC07067.1 hypothetical protein IHQ71_17755 [Rhizobium sp. TH2]
MSEHSPMPGIDEARIWDIVNQGWLDMSPSQKQFWEFIRIDPEQWLADPYKYRPQMAWVVAVIGHHVIWYNECWFGDQLDGMDSGFGCSNYTTHGKIGSHFSRLDTLLSNAVQTILHKVRPT